MAKAGNANEKSRMNTISLTIYLLILFSITNTAGSNQQIAILLTKAYSPPPSIVLMVPSSLYSISTTFMLRNQVLPPDGTLS